ncbi:hypothetical protein DL93DRAFT_2081131 [Clavulina sp. PMI_390]|nr:hypothetical protein DL93DRAFT_2081131 [Clavulina sp. PMI_390]
MTHNANDEVPFQPLSCCNEGSHPSAASLVRSHSLSIWTDGPMATIAGKPESKIDYVETQPILPFLLTWGYGISPSSLRSLRLRRRKHCSPIEEDMAQFPFAILRELSVLEELKWWVFGVGKLDISDGERDLSVVSMAAWEFLEAVTREATSDGLSMISFFASGRHYLELVRTCAKDTMSIQEQDEQQVVELQLLGGSRWRVSFKMANQGEPSFSTFSIS